MENIIVGINFSDQAITVIKYALSLAQHHGSKLIVAHILDYDDQEVSTIQVSEASKHEEIYEVFRLEKLQKVKSFVKRHRSRQQYRVSVQIEVRYGYTTEELRFIVRDINADLLIMGKHTTSGSTIFSDTSDKLIEYSPCPLFIVPQDTDFHPPKRIIYATDFILEDCESILYFQTWLKVFDAELICLHISKDIEEENKSMRKLSILEKLFPTNNIVFRHITNDVEKGIDRYVELTKADLVATIHKNRSFWEEIFKKSMSKAIAEDVKVPMIIFHQ